MATTSAGNNDISKASTPELFSGLLSDAKEIAVGHLGRMRGEISDELKELKKFLARTVLTVGVFVIGSILLGHAIAIGLATLGLPMWLGYLLTASIAIIGAILLVKGAPDDKTDMDLVPESAIADLTRDLQDLRHAGAHATEAR